MGDGWVVDGCLGMGGGTLPAAAGHGPAAWSGGTACLLECVSRRGGRGGLCAWRPEAAASSGPWQWPGQRRIRGANPRPQAPSNPDGLDGLGALRTLGPGYECQLAE